MIERTAYFAGKAIGSIRQSPGVSFITVATIAASLTMVGLFAMALQNLEGLALVWGRNATIIAYIDDQQTEAMWQPLRAQVEALPSVQRVELSTPGEALERFRNRSAEAAALVEGISEQVLPASLAITPQGGATDLARLEAVANEVKGVAGVAEVDYGRNEFEQLQALLDLLHATGWGLGILLVLATALIVSNTLRLTVYARRDEIGIMRLVGATGWFIRAPFLFEGAIWGAAGGLSAAAALWLADSFAAPRFSAAVADVLSGLRIELFALPVGLWMTAGGVLLGVLGSLLAVHRFLDAEAE